MNKLWIPLTYRSAVIPSFLYRSVDKALIVHLTVFSPLGNTKFLLFTKGVSFFFTLSPQNVRLFMLDKLTEVEPK